MTREPAPPGVAALPPAESAFLRPLRDRLVAAILDGTKTSTTSLVACYEHDGEPLPAVGDRSAMLDSAGDRVAVLEVTGVRVTALADVDVGHARDEGEGHESVARWRADHERSFHSRELRAELGDPASTTDDATPVVLERFRVVQRLDP